MLLCLWAFGLCVGLLSGLSAPSEAISPVFAGLGLAAGLGGAGWLSWLRRPVLAGLVVCLVGGAALGHRAAAPLSLPAPLAAALEAGRELEVEGRWVRTLRFADAETKARGLVAVERIDGLVFPCQVALTGTGQGPAPRPGDLVGFRVHLALPWGLRNPGLPDAIEAARAQGIDLLGWLPPVGHLVVKAQGGWWQPRRLAERAHGALGRAIEAVVPPARAALLRALVLGERSAAGPEVEAGFKAAGAVHALSVSGLHLTAVAGALFLLLRQLLARIPGLGARVRPHMLAAGLAIPALLFYCALSGEATATRRAAVMAALGFAAVVLGRTPALSSAFAASVFVLLVDSPLLLLDPSFQLSFGSVAAVALSGRNLEPVRGGPWWRRAGIWLGRGLWVSTAAFLATAPLVSHHFAELAPASPLGNLLLVPPVELGIVPLGLLGAALGALWAPLGYLPLVLADWLCRLSLALAAGFRLWAPVFPVPSLDGIEATALFGAALLALLVRRGSAWDRRLVIAAGLLGSVAALHLAGRALLRRWDRGVHVTFLDVGQGDAALIEGPAGFVALVDGGGSIDGTFDPGARVIEPVLRRKVIGRVDLVVLSHPHPDHMNGLFRVLERFDVGTLWSAGDGAGNPDYDRLVALARRRGVAVEVPRPLARAGLQLQPLGPFVGDEIAAPAGLDANDASLVVRLDFAGHRILFTGDIEAQGEAELLGRHDAAALACDLIKVPHHGSRTSSGDALLGAVHPGRAVMSLGRQNRFGFPRPEILERYRVHDVQVLRTDRDGAIAVDLAADGVLHTTCARAAR